MHPVFCYFSWCYVFHFYRNISGYLLHNLDVRHLSLIILMIA